MRFFALALSVDPHEARRFGFGEAGERFDHAGVTALALAVRPGPGDQSELDRLARAVTGGLQIRAPLAQFRLQGRYRGQRLE